MSYAEIASKGPKQSPEEAAAPPLPSLDISASTASTVSLVDVDIPSVRTVPSDFGDQSVTTETQAERLEREAAAEIAHARSRAASVAKQARAAGRKTAATVEAEARRADAWLTHQFASLQADHPTAATAAVAGNVAAVVGLGALLGVRAWDLHIQGRLSGKVVAIGLAIVGAVGLLESALANYFYKTKAKKQ